jgi:hypothetical protein
MAKQKRPHNINELALLIVDTAVGVPAKGDLLPDGTDPAAAEAGRKAARKGATRRAAKPSAKKKRSPLAKKAARTRRGR